jgi:hypothetical protein
MRASWLSVRGNPPPPTIAGRRLRSVSSPASGPAVPLAERQQIGSVSKADSGFPHDELAIVAKELY